MADQRPVDLWPSMKRLVIRSWRAPMESAHRAGRHIVHMLDGQVRPGDALDATGRWVREEYRAYARDSAAIGLRFAEAMVDMNLEYQQRFVQRVFPGAPRPSLSVTGAPGQRLTIELTLENDLDKAAVVRVLPSPLEAPGDALLEGALSVAPAGFSLEPGASRAVKVTVSLESAAVRPGQRWTGDLRIKGIGHEVRHVDVVVEVVEPPASP